MQEQRISQRTLVDQLLQVTDRRHQTVIGNLVNLSAEGFMLIARQPIDRRRYTELTLELPYPAAGKDAVRLEASCVWCHRSSSADDYGAGFRIEHMPAEDRRALREVFGGTD